MLPTPLSSLENMKKPKKTPPKKPIRNTFTLLNSKI